jgi:hypothetical protein
MSGLSTLTEMTEPGSAFGAPRKRTLAERDPSEIANLACLGEAVDTVVLCSRTVVRVRPGEPLAEQLGQQVKGVV